MKKLIRGIVEFHENRREDFAETFSQLALGQHPDALFIVCSDSRVAVNVFASTDPGDLFVLRNIGNVVPPPGDPGGTGAAAAISFALDQLRVRDIVICGHSDCGAIRAHCHGRENLPEGPLKAWLEIGTKELPLGLDPAETSRRNVLLQIEHLKSYPAVEQAMARGDLSLHGLWFDIRQADVLYYEKEPDRWTVLDGVSGRRILGRLETR